MNTRTCLLIPAIAAAIAMAACSGNSQNSSSSTTTTSNAAASPAASASAAAATIAPMTSSVASANGASVYNTNCSSCHQTNGKGLPGNFPPLAGNSVVIGDPAKVIHIVKNGLNDPIKVNGTSYHGQMPAWKQLKPAEIAAVITYIRSSWGNHASAVTVAQVNKTK